MTTKTNKTKTALRWWWMSLCLSAILWLGTKPLEQLSLQFQAIDEFESYELQEPHAMNTYQTCRYAAAGLGAISLIGLSWQLAREIRRKMKAKSTAPPQH